MRNFFIAAICMFVSSCDLIVDVNVPVPDEKLTVNCFYSDSSWTADVRHSRFILDNRPMEGLDDAVVTITEVETGETFTLDSTASGGYYSLHGRPVRYNSPYTLEVHRDGFESVHATMSIPPPVPIKSVKLDSEYDVDTNSKKLFVSLTFQDPAGENYYGVFLSYTFQNKFYEHTVDTTIVHYDTIQQPAFYLETNDPIVEEFTKDIGGLNFNDKTFENREYTFVFNDESPIWRSEDYTVLSVEIYLISYNEDYYSYLTTLRLQDWTDGDPFAEPVNVYNNIQNGFGIFGGLSRNIKTVNF